MFQSADELLAYVKDEDVETIDIRFCDLPGVMQHFTVPAELLRPEVFEDGLAFDGSSIRGFQKIHESDMALLPDPTTAVHRPVPAPKTLAVSFFVHDPLTKEPYSRDPRNIARKAEALPASPPASPTPLSSGPRPSSTSSTRPLRHQAERRLLLHRLRRRARGTPARDDGSGAQPRLQGQVQGRLLPGPAGRPLRRPARRHGAATWRASASTSSARTTRSAPPARPRSTTGSTPCWPPADEVMLFKYIIKNTAWAAGKTVTFMPKPLFGDNGSGMHAHQSLWSDGKPLFYDETGYARPVRHGPLLHRRPAAPRPVAAGLHQPDDELLPPPGARLRGAGQPGLLGPQPLRLHPHPDVPAPTRRPSASSSAARTRRRTPTWRSRPC